ncbi:MAG: 16S rRNA (guanine(966)-N(2))-methyltransferase RsmD [Rhodospirillaceae bacterium]
MRIVAGKHRGRTLHAPAGDAVRPTSDRIREALFNILAHAEWSPGLDGAQILDGFCGSGALGLEALSRGAASCVFMDSSADALDCARHNIAALKEDGRATLLRADVLKPPPARAPCTLALLDPPYGRELVVPALIALAAAGWLAPDALVIAEADTRDPINLPERFELLDNRAYRNTELRFLRFG